MMEKEDFLKLIDKYLSGEAKPSEEQMLLNYFESFQNGSQWEELGLGSKALTESQIKERLDLSIRKHEDQEAKSAPIIHRVHFLRRVWFRYAAAIIILFGIGSYLRIANKKSIQSPVIAKQTADIVPGKDGAILTLADGSQVVLDSLGNGVISTQQGSEVLLKDGRLFYTPVTEASGDIVYNTMTTPKGRQFNLVLPDGTQVWLNAASSLRYPTAFIGKERNVEVSGEAYFEVARNTKMPFRVSINDMSVVEVLGTSFNVNAYENEKDILTTLLEGSVKVKVVQEVEQIGHTIKPVKATGRPEIILQPGQQAKILKHIQPGITVINNADMEKVMAWKNGLFNFEGAHLEEVMKQLERWYDIEVIYERSIPNITFRGKIAKDISLNDLLAGLKQAEVNFRIEGRKLIVLP